MRRLVSALSAVALLAIAALAIAWFLDGESRAELDSQVFTSRADRLRMVVPRSWRATDQPSYPNLLLWMMHSQPPGQIVLTAEPFTRDLYCSWQRQSQACRAQTTPTQQYACFLREKLIAQKMKVGPAQLGPKENEEAGAPSVWFEYDDGKRFLRHAVTVTEDRAISLVLSAPTNDARAQHVRAFDQALRSLQILTTAEAQPIGIDAAIVTTFSDGGAADATMLADAAVLDGGVTFTTSMPKENPIGPCKPLPAPGPKKR
jgi:hypothetical protein